VEALIKHFANFDALWNARVVLLEGALGTLKLGSIALILSMLAGAVIFAVQISGGDRRRKLVEWYIDVMRAMPLMVLLVIVHYVIMPLLGVRVDPFYAAAFAFLLKHGAYFSEIYRSGWLAIEKGQILAANALGLRQWRIVQMVIVPQLSLIVIPAMTSQATLLLRDLPLAFAIGYFEILTSARAAQVFTRNSTPLLGAVVAYSVTLLLLQWLTGRLERYSRRRLEA
jgi:polar amino acid transport system permease protein